jgi:polysaccharide deacetylase 2 family uncharacterized protein YibQ
VCLICFPSWAQRSSGTGFAIAPGLIVTNQHVVNGCSSLSVELPMGERRTARLIAVDPELDLALVYVLGLPGSIAAIRTTAARLGEQIYAFGFPLAGTLASAGNFTSGLVSALRGLGDKEGVLQFTAPVQPGNSGGALLDKSGLVIGVVRSKLDAIEAARVTGDIPQNVNFAVSGDILAKFLAKHDAPFQHQATGAFEDPTIIAERAQSFTFHVSCGRSGELGRVAELHSGVRRISAPDPALQEEGLFGPIPRVGDNGRTSIRAYSGEFDRQDRRPRIGIIVADIGISAPQTDDAIRRLPPAMTLVISPYAPYPAQVAERLRARGVESLLGLPLEPADYPLNDPGNRALLTGRTLAENNEILEWLLARFPAYVGAIGVVGGMRGERFAAFEQGFLALQETLRNRGLLFIDARPGAATPMRAWGRAVDVVLDEPATHSEIERRLAEVEAIAKARGSALGLAHAATPLVVDRLVAWAAGLNQRGLVLAPMTALARRPSETVAR